MAVDPAGLTLGVTVLLLTGWYATRGVDPMRARVLFAAIVGLPSLVWACIVGAPVGPDLLPALGLGAAFGLSVQPFLWLSAGTAKSQAVRPEVRADEWTADIRVRNALSWGVYLLAYEGVFRGVLLLGLAPSLGGWTSASVVTAMYALFHLGKPWDETAGSLPVGLVLAAMALRTHTFVGPFVAHWMIAVGSDTWAVARAHSLAGAARRSYSA
jgi:membrane protease YdiL (CAAX protease family)